jgi:hypothetical protein
MKHADWKKEMGVKTLLIRGGDKDDPDTVYVLTRRGDDGCYIKGDTYLDRRGIKKLVDFLVEFLEW